ncbi:MAG TPA: zinc ribbon domain-containing protein [Vicinamibacteria bacterium]|nr:zinc ribbon domain-containing protein [Vicinamibacteria bacterium]
MPIYEYACSGCGARFEKLVRAFGEAVSCPVCSRADVEKQLSVFAVASSSSSAPAVRCGEGACAAADGNGSPCGAGGCMLG